MADEPELAVVYSPRPWASQLVRYLADHGGGRVRLRIVEGRAALEEHFDVLLAEDITSWLTHRLMGQLRQGGRRVLGVYDPEEPTGKERLRELGVDAVVEASAEPEEFLRALATLAPDTERERSAGLRLPAPPEPPPRATTGHVTVVGGPSGGPGATEVAIELAHALRLRGEAVVLVDADDTAPAVAQRLGLEPVPNLRTAVDALHHHTARLVDTLAPVRVGGFEALAGLSAPGDWSQLRPGDARDVVGELARQRQHVVINIGHRLEDLGRFGGPDRYGLSRGLLPAADTLLAVGAPTPVGVARLVRWVAEVTGASGGRLLHIVVNRTPRGEFVRGELAEEINRSCRPASLRFLPADPAVGEAAWRGTLVTGGPWSKAVSGLAAGVVPRVGAVPQPRHRSRRLALSLRRTTWA